MALCTIRFLINYGLQRKASVPSTTEKRYEYKKIKNDIINGFLQISVSGCKSLDSALLIQEPWSNSTEKTEMLLGNLSTFIPKVRGCRAYGSAGINLSYLAMGAVDAYFEFGYG